MLRIGIAGYGKIGKIRHENLKKEPACKVVAIFDAYIDFEVQDDIIKCKDYEELLSSDIDAVFICTYNDTLVNFSKSALQKNIHVFCEKPPARNVKELMSLYSVYKSGNSILKYGFNHRYHYSVIEAKKIIQEGKMGKLLWMRGVYGKAGSIDFKSNWRNYKNISGGGILIDQGIHMLDLFRYLSGLEFIVKASVVKNLYWDIEAEDNVFALLSSNNTIASIHSTATQWKHKFSLEMTFENGYLNLDGILSATRSYSPERLVVGYKSTENVEFAMGKPTESISTYEIDSSWHLEIKEFLNAIISDQKISHGTIEDALKNLELIEKIYNASNE